MNYEKGKCKWFSGLYGRFLEDGTYDQCAEWLDLPNCDEEGRYQAIGLQSLDLGQHQPSLP